MQNELQDVNARFDIPGRYLGAEPYGNGHINDTYAVWWDHHGRRRTLLQRINHHIFQDIPRLMDNIARVTDHLRRQLAACPTSDPDRETLTLIPTRDGARFHRDATGNYWRSYVFIEKATTYDICQTPRQALEAARAFGRFQRLLADLPPPPLHETIPFFHHTPRRFKALREVIERDPLNRAGDVAKDIEFALRHESLTEAVTRGLTAGTLPWRITHNDTKLNNVMLDDRTGRGICVIDLDTVMPGSSLYDFGDLVRTSTRDAAEDEPDPRRNIFRLDMFEQLVRGYLETAREFLTAAEREGLVVAAQLLTFTIGIRFLTDYLAGDTYFKISRPGQNLDRARVQFQLLRHMETQDDAMHRIVAAFAI